MSNQNVSAGFQNANASISLAEQAAAVRRDAVNLRGHVANLRDLVARKKRPQHELDIAAQWLPALEAAADTMEKLAAGSQSSTGGAGDPPPRGGKGLADFFDGAVQKSAGKMGEQYARGEAF